MTTPVGFSPRLLGIMGGRMLPPVPGRFQSFQRDGWREEIRLAGVAGVEAIEWIYDAFGEDVNPLATDAGLAELRTIALENKVEIRSTCADYFMDRPFLRVDEATRRERLGRLEWLLDRCALAGIERVVLPFVDASRIDGEEDLRIVVSVLESVLPIAVRTNVELHLETALDPTGFAALLARIPHPLVKVNYDSGNSASLGFAPAAEFAAYGARVGSVHVKDRVLGASTVPLGTGNTDFFALHQALRTIGYRGDLVMQVARGEAGDEVEWTRMNLAWVRRWIAEGQGS